MSTMPDSSHFAQVPTDKGQGEQVAMIFVWRSLGHVNASLGLARRLQSLGYSIIFSGPSEIREEIERQGYRFHAVAHLEWVRMPYGIRRRPSELLRRRPFISALRDARAAALNETERFRQGVSQIIESTNSIVRQMRPAFVVFDPFLLVYALPFLAHSVPVVALSTKVLATADPVVPPYTVPLLPPHSLLSRIALRSVWWRAVVSYGMWEIYERLFSGSSLRGLARTLARECGISMRNEWKTRPLLTDCKFASVPEWVLHAQEFDFPRERPLPADVRYLGPCVDRQRTELPLTVPEEILNGPLIVCVMSSVFHPGTASARRRLLFLQELMACMAQNPDLSLVLSTGCKHDFIGVDAIPPNVKVYEHIPVLKFLERASLLITQGGANIAKEAILCGVPMLVFPGHGDQPGMSARIVFHGIGKRSDAERTTAQEIAALIREVLHDDGMRKAAARMREHLQFDETLLIAERLRELGVPRPVVSEDM
jgi:MGT family glycosyltransferase